MHIHIYMYKYIHTYMCDVYIYIHITQQSIVQFELHFKHVGRGADSSDSIYHELSAWIKTMYLHHICIFYIYVSYIYLLKTQDQTSQ